MAVLAAKLAADLAGAKFAADVQDSRLLYALVGTGTNRFQTPAGGGERGVDTGLFTAVLFQLGELPPTSGYIYLAGTQAGNRGYQQIVINSGGVVSIQSGFGNAAGLFVYGPTRLVTASDVGKIFLHVSQHTGAGNLVRSYVDRAEQGSGIALVGMLTATDPFAICGRPADNSGLTSRVLAHATWRGTQTLAQMQALYDFVRAAGDFPDAIEGATAYRVWSVRREIAAQALAAVTGTAAPATVREIVSGAALDLLGKVGAPTVQVIDPIVDGRKTYGFQGASASAYLQSANGAGIRGNASGFYLAIPAVWDQTQLSGFRTVAACGDGASVGWMVQTSNTSLRVIIGTGSGISVSTSVTLSQPDYSQPDLIIANFTGTAIRLYRRRVSAGADVATAFAAAPAGTPMTLGVAANGAQPAACAVFGLQGGDVAGGLSTAQIDRLVSSWESGRIAALGVANEHLYDLTADITVSGPDAGVPAIVLDRVGSGHLTRSVLVVDSATRGMTKFAPGATYRTAQTITTAAGGFMVAARFVRGSAGTGNRRPLIECSVGSSGFQLQYDTSGAYVYLRSWSGAGVQTDTGTSGTQLTDAGVAVGQVATIFAFFDPATSRLECYINKTRIGTGVAMTGHASATARIHVGARDGSGLDPLDNAVLLEAAYGAAVPTVGEINAATDAATTFIATKTSYRWHFPTDLAVAAESTTILDRVGDRPLERVGTGLTVAQRVERLWSYESSPIMKSAGFSAGNRFETAAAAGLLGIGGIFWIGLMYRVLSSITGRLAATHDGGNSGWQATLIGGTQLQWGARDGTATSRSAPSITTVADGKIRCALMTMDGTTLRAYGARAQAGSGTGCVGYTAPTAATTIGSLSGGSSPGSGGEVLGLVGGIGVASLAEFLAWEDACMAAQDIQPIPGKTDHGWSLLKRHGTGLRDLFGADHMAAVGTPTETDIYARAFAW